MWLMYTKKIYELTTVYLNCIESCRLPQMNLTHVTELFCLKGLWFDLTHTRVFNEIN